ncbi:MAG: Hsp70 family protein, partial [Gammaproteobacteria bacterium]|nr:Hsp70 family protein [Gammaproteobacteria bacterium]
HSVKKSLEEIGDDIDADEKEAIETASAALEEAIKGDDKDDIEAKTKALTDASAKMAEKLYAKNSGDAGIDPASAAAAAAAAGTTGSTDDADDVVDAEFEEVDDKK